MLQATSILTFSRINGNALNRFLCVFIFPTFPSLNLGCCGGNVDRHRHKIDNTFTNNRGCYRMIRTPLYAESASIHCTGRIYDYANRQHSNSQCAKLSCMYITLTHLESSNLPQQNSDNGTIWKDMENIDRIIITFHRWISVNLCNTVTRLR